MVSGITYGEKSLSKLWPLKYAIVFKKVHENKLFIANHKPCQVYKICVSMCSILSLCGATLHYTHTPVYCIHSWLAV